MATAKDDKIKVKLPAKVAKYGGGFTDPQTGQMISNSNKGVKDGIIVVGNTAFVQDLIAGKQLIRVEDEQIIEDKKE